MNRPMKRLLFWSPRVLTLLYAAFLILVALDLLEKAKGSGEAVIGLFVTLIWTSIILVVLFYSWFWEWIGAVLFVALALFHATMAWGQPGKIVVSSGPLFVVGGLFLANWLKRKEIRARS